MIIFICFASLFYFALMVLGFFLIGGAIIFCINLVLFTLKHFYSLLRAEQRLMGHAEKQTRPKI